MNGEGASDMVVTAVMDHETGIIELAVKGRWERHSWLDHDRLEAGRVVRKCLAEHPPGLVLGLDHLDDSRADSASLWLTTASQGRRMEPPVPVVACVTPDSPLAGKLGRMDARHLLPVFPTRRLALTSIASHRPQTSQVRLELQPHVGAAATARQLVAAACEEWHMPLLLPRARLIVSELVANGVEHAGTTIDVVVSHRGTVRRTAGHRDRPYLHLAVYDRNSRIPQAVPPAGGTPGGRGRGLRIVSVASDGWGILPTHEGKVVWAMLREESA